MHTARDDQGHSFTFSFVSMNKSFRLLNSGCEGFALPVVIAVPPPRIEILPFRPGGSRSRPENRIGTTQCHEDQTEDRHYDTRDEAVPGCRLLIAPQVLGDKASPAANGRREQRP